MLCIRKKRDRGEKGEFFFCKINLSNFKVLAKVFCLSKKERCWKANAFFFSSFIFFVGDDKKNCMFKKLLWMMHISNALYEVLSTVYLFSPQKTQNPYLYGHTDWGRGNYPFQLFL